MARDIFDFPGAIFFGRGGFLAAPVMMSAAVGSGVDEPLSEEFRAIMAAAADGKPLPGKNHRRDLVASMAPGGDEPLSDELRKIMMTAAGR
jgi:hypothetical protein